MERVLAGLPSSSTGTLEAGSALKSVVSAAPGEAARSCWRTVEKRREVSDVPVEPSTPLGNVWPKRVVPKSTSRTTVICVEMRASQRLAATMKASRAAGLFCN